MLAHVVHALVLILTSLNARAVDYHTIVVLEISICTYPKKENGKFTWELGKPLRNKSFKAKFKDWNFQREWE